MKRPETRLPQSRAGGQGRDLRSIGYLGRSSEAESRKKVQCDGRSEGLVDRKTDKVGC